MEEVFTYAGLRSCKLHDFVALKAALGQIFVFEILDLRISKHVGLKISGEFAWDEKSELFPRT